MVVDTMPTPIKSIARMQTAMSQCNRRLSGVKRWWTPIMAWCSLQFGDNPWPPPCAGHTTSHKRPTVRPGTDRPIPGCRSARRADRRWEDGRIEVDVAARAIPLGLDLLRDKRADLDGAAVGRPGLARVGGRVARISDRHHQSPALRRAGDTLSDLLFEVIRAALGKIIRCDRDQLRRRQQRPTH